MSAIVRRIDESGQVVLPEEILHLHGLRNGDEIEFVSEGGMTLVRPVQPGRGGFHAWIGALPLPDSEENAVERQRKLRGWDEWDYRKFAE